jgi:hypothetical protein
MIYPTMVILALLIFRITRPAIPSLPFLARGQRS